jgi:hypothetical protein
MHDFDDHMKKRAGDFKLEPRRQVWENIAQELDGKKWKRRFVWFWWLMPLLLAGGGIAVYQYNTGEKPSLEKNTTTISQTNPTTVPKQDVNTPELNIVTPDHIETIPTPAVPALQQAERNITTKVLSGKTAANPFVAATPVMEIESQNNSTTINTENLPPLTTGKAPKAEVLLTETQPAETIIMMNDSNLGKAPIMVKTEKSDAMSATNKVSSTTTVSLTQKDSLPEIAAEKMIADSQPPLADKIAMPPAVKNPRNARWNIAGGIGLHNHAGKGIELQLSALEYNGGLQNSNSGGFGSTNTPMEPTKPGVGFMLGVERSQHLGASGKWSWIGGLHYQYQTFSALTGPRIDSGISFRTDASGVEKSAAYFYRPGNTIEHTGKQHRAHLLAGIQWHFDKSRKWTWQNGFYGGIVFTNDYLLPQGSTTGWVSSKGLTRKGYFGMETGIQFQPGQWGAGLYGQYNLSSSVNVSSLPPQYWRGLELRIQYKISSTPSKK